MASKPNDWTKRVSKAAREEGELTELKQLQLEYWTRFNEHLEETSRRVTVRKPRAQHWANYAVGRSGCRLSARVNSQTHTIGVDLGLSGGAEAEQLFQLLQSEREAIEAEIGLPLSWKPKPSKKVCMVSTQWEGEDPTDRERWGEQHRRLAEALDAFHEALSPRLRALDPSQFATY